jgi:hypothetical protein
VIGGVGPPELPLFRTKDHRAALAMMVFLPAQRPAVYVDGRWCTWMYETRNETIAAPAALRLAACSGLDAAVGAVDRGIEVRGDDAEPGGGEYGFKQPPEGAELGAEMLGEVLPRMTVSRVLCRVIQPGIKNRLGLCGLEVEDQVSQAQHCGLVDHCYTFKRPIQG